MSAPSDDTGVDDLFELGRQLGRAEGRKEGRAQGRKEMRDVAVRAFKDLDMPGEALLIGCIDVDLHLAVMMRDAP